MYFVMELSLEVTGHNCLAASAMFLAKHDEGEITKQQRRSCNFLLPM